MKQCISTSALLTSFFIFIALFFMMPMNAQATTTTSGEYVGYFGEIDSYTPATGSIKYTLNSLYVTPISNYKSTQGLDDPSNVEVAYCFNKNGQWPANSSDGYWYERDSQNKAKILTKVNGLTIYNKVDNATADVFYGSTTNPRITDPDEFRTQILSIGLNGYPYDYSDFNKDANGKQILSDYNFRALTQYAIWYYTDSFDDINELYMTERSWTADEIRIYKELITTTLPKDITDAASSEIDLYLWNQQPAFGDTATIYKEDGSMVTTGSENYSDPYAVQNNAGWQKGYQNLLAVDAKKTSQIKSLVATRTLTLSKATTGSLSGKFTFDISLGAGTTYWVNEENADNVVDHGNGKLTVTLENGESVALKIVGTSYSYTIEETNASAYKTSISVKKGDGAVSATNSKLISGTNVTGDTHILYTNTGTNEENTKPSDTSDDDDDYYEDDDYYYYDDDDYVHENYKLVNTVPSKNSTPDLLKETENATGDGAEAADGSGFLDVAAAMPSPKTADSSNLVLWFGLMAICVAAGVLILRRRIK